MYSKALAVTVLFLSFILIVGTLSSRSVTPGSPKPTPIRQQGEGPTSLRARVRKEKAKGEKKVKFGGPVPIYAETTGLEEAAANYLIVLARPLEVTTLMLSPDKLTTFQKFEILDRLTTSNTKNCCGPKTSDLPPTLEAPKPNEIYVRMNGGTYVIDDVEVIQEPEFNFNGTEDYLLFLLPDETGAISTIPLGPYGIFNVKGDSVESILNYPHVLDTEIKSKHNGALSRLRAKLKPTR
jgi:hypothetical protein